MRQGRCRPQSHVRDLFEQAAKHAPSLIFVDELDALGKARGANPLSPLRVTVARVLTKRHIVPASDTMSMPTESRIFHGTSRTVTKPDHPYTTHEPETLLYCYNPSCCPVIVVSKTC